MDKLTIFLTLIALSTVHGEGCSLQSTTDVLYEVLCDSSLDNLKNLVPQYITIERNYDYNYRYYHNGQPDRRLNDRNINLKINNIDLDTNWSSGYYYMNEKIQKLIIDNVGSLPNKITKFNNLKELENGMSYVLRDVKLNIFLDLTKLQRIEFTYNFIENIIIDHPDLRTSNVNSIDFSHNRIETLPNSCFANFPQLRVLNLSHNLIQNIDLLTFEGIQNLETFDISHNRIKEIGHNFVRFVNVKYMYLNNNNLTKIIEPNFITMNKLKQLYVNYNELKFIEENSFQSLENIEVLDLSNNSLTKIAKDTFKNNIHLHKISFGNNPIQKIESNVFQGQNFTIFEINDHNLSGNIEKNSFVGIFKDSLNLSCGRIESLDSEAFSGLQTPVLNLSYNIINNISVTSFKGIQLTNTLDLSNNNLSSIDFETTDLKQLQHFYVQNNRISKISKSSFDNFVSLKEIDISHNNLLELEPGTFSKLNQLEFLDLSNNYLANSLQANAFQGLSSVKNIQLMFNRFTTIENNTFEGLQSLNMLNCSHGELSSIGYSALENTGNIEILDLSYNSLRDFIINTTSIESLKELRLNDNALNNITEQMPKIEKINLANNNIGKLKAKLFASSTNLTVLDLSSNNGIEFEEIFETVSFLSVLSLCNIRKQFNFENVKVSISKIDMSFNNIENISSVFIYKIKGINFLDLKTNKITIIDKLSFQNMPELTSLDLSFNLISFVQPGSFLQLSSLKMLNLHGNSIQALQFGVLDGLNYLETLNLSSNSIREFGGNILRSSPAIRMLALDNNVIEKFKFDEFTPSNIEVITIGGNPLSCHTIADFKKRRDVFNVTAEVLDYHTENIDGVKCMTNFVFNKSSSLVENKSDINGTASFWILARAVDGFRASVENFRQSIDKLSLNTPVNKNNEVQVQNTYENVVNNSDFKALFRNIASIEGLMHNITNITQTSAKVEQKKFDNKIEDKNINFNLQEKINILYAEKEKMIKELHNHFENLKQDHFENHKQDNVIKSDAQVKIPDNNRELTTIMYFVAVCLTISVILSLSTVIVKFFGKNKQYQRGGYRYSSAQPIANGIELQDN